MDINNYEQAGRLITSLRSLEERRKIIYDERDKKSIRIKIVSERDGSDIYSAIIPDDYQVGNSKQTLREYLNQQGSELINKIIDTIDQQIELVKKEIKSL